MHEKRWSIIQAFTVKEEFEFKYVWNKRFILFAKIEEK